MSFILLSVSQGQRTRVTAIWAWSFVRIFGMAYNQHSRPHAICHMT